MNILFVDRNTKIGGGSTYLRTLVPAIGDHGHQCYLIAGGGSARQQVAPAFEDAAGHPPIIPLAERAIASALRRWDIDVVVTQTTRSARHVLAPCKKACVPLVMNVHGRHGIDECARSIDHASAVIAMNRGTAEYVRNCCPAAADKVHVCPLPVDVARFAPVDETDTEGLNITHCCRLSRNQSVQAYVTIQAADGLSEEFPGLSVTIVGGQGDRLRRLRDQADDVNAKHQRMFATAPGQLDDPRPYLAQADVVIGGGYVALEALAMNRRVIGVASAGLWGLVEEDSFEAALDANFGGSGDENSELSTEALTPILRRALTSHLAEGQITWGHRLVTQTCAPEKIAQQVLEIYRAALG